MISYNKCCLNPGARRLGNTRDANVSPLQTGVKEFVGIFEQLKNL